MDGLLAYVFDEDGFYNGAIELPCRLAFTLFMHAKVPQAFAEKREVIITDLADDCVFHMKDGKILHCGGGDCAELERALTLIVRQSAAAWN